MTDRRESGLLQEALSKAPQPTLLFWMVKICATTVGETGGDAILDRLVHNAHRFNMTGDSMRKIIGRRALDEDLKPLNP